MTEDVTVIFVLPNGSQYSIAGKSGASVMQTAIDNGVPGIVAECGGALSCATCHVYVAEADMPRLEPIEAFEHEMLDGTASERRPTSRLSCQIRLSPDLSGLVVTIPETQS